MITLILGGARSGKSVVAERLVAKGPTPITYIATLRLEGDPDLAARVARHRQRRPAEWETVEAGADLPLVLRATAGTVLLDSLGPWVSGHAESEPVDAVALCRALRERTGDTVIVSEEVGLGVHPSSSAGLRFRDVLGALNHAVADVADEAYLIVAGRALRLDSAP